MSSLSGDGGERGDGGEKRHPERAVKISSEYQVKDGRIIHTRRSRSYRNPSACATRIGWHDVEPLQAARPAAHRQSQAKPSATAAAEEVFMFRVLLPPKSQVE